MTRAVLPERVTLHLWGSGTFTTRAQCRQPRLSQPCTRSLRIDVSAPARASPQHLPASPCSLTTVSCPDCCRVRSSADAHGIVLAVLCLLCLLGGGVWWCRRQGTKRRADQQRLFEMGLSSASASSDIDL